jgi:histidinol phosphatase-like enzyme
VSDEYEYIGINKNVKFDDHQKYFEHILGVQSLIDSDTKTELAQRRTNLKEMIVRNQEGISRLPSDWQDQIKSSHNKRIRKLSAEIRKG